MYTAPKLSQSRDLIFCDRFLTVLALVKADFLVTCLAIRLVVVNKIIAKQLSAFFALEVFWMIGFAHRLKN